MQESTGATARRAAVLLVSFGGPEAPEDVMPFLRNVTAGRHVPEARLEQVAEQYQSFGGVSPINAQNLALARAIEAELASRGRELRVYLGNRNWDPFITETLGAMVDEGVERAAVVLTSGFSSYSGCRQYRENVTDAVAVVAEDGVLPILAKARQWFDHPGLIEAMTDRVADAVTGLGGSPRLVFTTHSIPMAMALSSGPPDFPAQDGAYVAQQRYVASIVSSAVGKRLGKSFQWDLVFQSRSGSPTVEWLEPDINDHLKHLKKTGCRSVVAVPIGFSSDHLEVLWDLDTVAAKRATELEIAWARAETAGTHPAFVAALADVALEALDEVPTDGVPALSPWGPWPRNCPVNCCTHDSSPRTTMFEEGSS